MRGETSCPVAFSLRIYNNIIFKINVKVKVKASLNIIFFQSDYACLGSPVSIAAVSCREQRRGPNLNKSITALSGHYSQPSGYSRMMRMTMLPVKDESCPWQSNFIHSETRSCLPASVTAISGIVSVRCSLSNDIQE